MIGAQVIDGADLTAFELARFWSSVDVGRSCGRKGRCWPWHGARQRKGYGSFKLRGRSVPAHRVAYAIFFASAPADLTIRHGCDNPPCCHPMHLVSGTNLENIMDRVRRNRGGSTLTEANVLEIKRLRAAGLLQREVAERFGVTQGTISNIDLGITWSYVKDVS